MYIQRRLLFSLLSLLLLKLGVVFGFNSLDANEKEYQVGVGSWRVHLNFQDVHSIAEVKDRIYAGSTDGLFYYDKSDRSVGVLSKVDGLNDVHLDVISYNEAYDALFLGYSSTNIDVIQSNSIRNIADLTYDTRPGAKEINTFSFYENLTYISTSFGVHVYDMDRREFRESYTEIDLSLNQNTVYDVAVFNGYIYASLPSGIFRANINSPNLKDPSFWELTLAGYGGKLAVFNNRLYAIADETIYHTDENDDWQLYDDPAGYKYHNIRSQNDYLMLISESGFWQLDKDGTSQLYNRSALDVITDKSGLIWIGRFSFGLIQFDPVNGEDRFYWPNGPVRSTAFDIAYENGRIWIATGGVDDRYNNLWWGSGFSKFENNRWTTYREADFEEVDAFADVLTVKKHPSKSYMYFGSFHYGILRLDRDGEVMLYNGSNSTLGNANSPTPAKVSGFDFDSEENLWITNYAVDYPLVVKYSNGEWGEFNLPENYIGDISIDAYDQKWIILPRTNHLIVASSEYVRGNPNSVQTVRLTEEEGRGNLPGNDAHVVKSDHNGTLWIGTSDGIGVIDDPSAVFQGRNYDARRIWVRHEGEEGWLLRRQRVNDIAIDAANRKWIASNNGVWVTSPDGTEIIHHFTAENSPLLSNNVFRIGIHQSHGEVFMSTDLGIVSYRSSAITGQAAHHDVYVYPNPVRHDYDGPISVRGLVSNANVKITDISGKLVYETTAQGSQAVWNGKNFEGQRAASGVYLVFSTNEDGTETYVTKLLFIR